MNFKNLLISASLIATMPALAATYYVTPEGAGTKDGSNWENAFGIEELITQAAANSNGDIYNLAGGTYKPSQTVVFKTATGAILNGSADGERTIFSGDKDDNNRATSGDANRLIRFQPNTAHGAKTNLVQINDIDFTCVYTVSNDGTDNMGALMIDNAGYVEVNSCNFYNNWSDGSRGGAAALFYRSNVVLTNCVFRNNSANYRGVIRLTSNANTKGYTTFQNCVFKDNKNYHNLGGVICAQQSQQVNLIGCTMTLNSAATQGGAIYINGKDASYANHLMIVNSTIAGNTVSGDVTEDGQIYSTQGGNISVINSIIVSRSETTKDFYFGSGGDATKFSFVSGGYNVAGSVAGVPAPAAETEAASVVLMSDSDSDSDINWLPTDHVSADNTYAEVFGTNTLNSDNQLIPAKYFAGAGSEQVKAATSNWGLPESADFGDSAEGDTPGSYAVSAGDLQTGVDEIVTENEVGSITAIGVNCYRIAGARCIEAYTISGAQVAVVAGDVIDLNSLQNGIYVLRAGNKSFKVIK